MLSAKTVNHGCDVGSGVAALSSLIKHCFSYLLLESIGGGQKNVLALLWQSGREGTKFHLNDGVLIALVTTSVANFLALVLIIARNLFPGRSDQ